MAWEVTRTVRVRLDVPDDRKSDLHATNNKFQYCANRTADWAWRYPDEDCVTSKSEAEDAIYDDLRDETDSVPHKSSVLTTATANERLSKLVSCRSPLEEL